MTMKNQITLGTKVVVSDPCYEIPTWCQAIVDGVKPGKYYVHAHKLDIDGWGERVCALVAIHEDHEFSNIYLDLNPNEIGVDSGQAGIFDFDSYRNDGHINLIPRVLEEPFRSWRSENETGCDWYDHVSEYTLSDESWGRYEYGTMSSSGIGDGSYSLYTATVDENSPEIVGFVIDFGLDGNIIENLEEMLQNENA